MRNLFARSGLVTLVVGLVLPVAATATTSSWDENSPVPLGRIRYGHAQCAGDPGRFYVVSGVDRTFNVTITMERFDTATGKWAALASVPEPSQGPVAVCLGRQIHLLGGADHHGLSTTKHFVYDIDGDRWSAAAALPRPVWGASAGGYGGKVYLAGGDDDFEPGGTSAEVDVYDVATDTWTRSAPMPQATLAAGSAQAGRYLYLAGGWDDSSPATNVAATQRLDLATGAWTTGPDMLTPQADFALAATGSQLFAIGGDGPGGEFRDASAIVQKLSLAQWPNGHWTAERDPLPESLAANSGGFATPGRIWSVGGASPVSGITDLTLSRRP